jgi:hypothetical protein
MPQIINSSYSVNIALSWDMKSFHGWQISVNIVVCIQYDSQFILILMPHKIHLCRASFIIPHYNL